MAKIYETHRDVERESVARRIREARENKRIFAGLAAVSGLLSVLYLRAHELGEELLAQSRDIKNLLLGSDHVKGCVAALGVVVSAGIAFALHDKEYKLKKKAEMLGPEKVILPVEVDVPQNSSLESQTINHVARLEKKRVYSQLWPEI